MYVTDNPAAPRRARGALAALLAVVLALFGALAAPAVALAAEGTVSSAVTGADENGLTIAVDAAGLPNDASAAYAALVVEGNAAGVNDREYIAFAMPFPAVSDGRTSFTLRAPVDKLERGTSYEVVMWRQHSDYDAENAYGSSVVPIGDEHWDAVFPPEIPVEPEAPTEPTEPAEPTEPEQPTESEVPVEPEVPTASLSVSETEGLDPAGETLTIQAMNFDASADSVYTPGKAGFYVQVGWISETWRPSEGAASAARSNAYSTWVADAANRVAPTKWVENGDGTANATWEVTVEESVLLEKRIEGATLAVFTSGAGGVVQPGNERAVPISFADDAPVDPGFGEPAIDVFLADGVTPVGDTEIAEGDVLVVRGTGFDPAANVGGSGVPIPSDLPQGTFVVFGSFADEWQPSAGISSDQRVMDKGSRVWALAEDVLEQVPPLFQSSIRESWTPIDADGSFVAEIAVHAPETPLADGNWGIYTYPGGVGTPANPSQELAVPIVFDTAVEPIEPVEPTDPSAGALEWSLSTSFYNYIRNVAGGTVTASAGATDDSGVFGFPQAVEGTDYDEAAGTGSVAYAGWVHFTAHGGALDVTVGNPRIEVFDERAATLTVSTGAEDVVLAELDLDTAVKAAASGVVRYTGAEATLTEAGLRAVFGGSQPSSGLAPVDFRIGEPVVQTLPATPGDGTVPVDPGRPVDPTEPTTPTVPKPSTPTEPETTVPGGALRWGISKSFVSYITGDIAKGAIAVSGGATRAGGVFQFGQATGSTYDVATGLGAVSYVGSVRFTGHHGALDVTVSRPQVRITSASSATLYVTNGGDRVALATLDLAAGSKRAADGAVTYRGVPATLTGAGQSQVFAGHFTNLDPVTFTIGAPAKAPSGSTGTVASAPTDEQRPAIPSTPPATDGIDIDEANLAALAAGEAFTISAGGFQPTEEGIRVVVYSTPVLLGTVTADASGTASWTGTLPAALADGEHTLTLQGSVSRGLVFDLQRTEVIGQCVVDAAELHWGYKESFRVYVEGIANGGWDLSGLEYRYPDFVWSGGAGSYDDGGAGLVTFGGELHFNGHDGALDTTFSNAAIELSGEVGYLLFDIAGATQDGQQVDQQGVRFVEFSLADATVVDGVLTLEGAATTLTDAGSAAFGTYAAGEAFDPVSFELPVGSDCGVTVDEPVEADPPPVEGAITPISAPAEDGSDVPLWAWIVIALLVVGAGTGAGVVVSRRRAAAAAASAATATTEV